jgi:hypothetical protein
VLDVSDTDTRVLALTAGDRELVADMGGVRDADELDVEDTVNARLSVAKDESEMVWEGVANAVVVGVNVTETNPVEDNVSVEKAECDAL